jgi:hypothetical protein
MREYFVVNGRKVTSNGFCQATDFSGKPKVFRTLYGKQEPVMLGVTEWSLPGCEEFFKGENHQQTHKTGARFIIWLPNAKGWKKGVTVDGKMYQEAQANPEAYPERVQRLAEFGIGLDIDCR